MYVRDMHTERVLCGQNSKKRTNRMNYSDTTNPEQVESLCSTYANATREYTKRDFLKRKA